MALFDRVVRLLCKFCDRIAQAAVVAMLLLIVGNILLRIVWKPILGTYDIAGFIGAILIAFAIAYCAVQRGHIQVELLVALFPERAQAIIGSITGILSLFIFSLVTWQSIVLANDMRRVGEVSMSAHISFYPYIYGVAFGCALLCLVILVDLIKSLVMAVKR
jgi:TRAP-type C4-dicarboxylate transport system permease small subunit